MRIKLKKKYLVGTRQARGSKNSSEGGGNKRSKGLMHPLGFSGRTTGKLVANYKGK